MWWITTFTKMLCITTELKCIVLWQENESLLSTMQQGGGVSSAQDLCPGSRLAQYPQ